MEQGIELQSVESVQPLVQSGLESPRFDYKEWKKNKKHLEAFIFQKLYDAFQRSRLADFENFLEECFCTLEKIYNQLDAHETKNKKESDEQGRTFSPGEKTYQRVLKNDQLHLLLAKMIRTEGSSDFLQVFLKKVPIINKTLDRFYEVPIRESKQQKQKEQETRQGKEPNRVIHIAIKARAFENVKTLLEHPGVDVNVVWQYKKYTPLMMLIAVVDSSNFRQVMELVKILAWKKANINIGTFTMHPLSVICKLETVTFEEKMELLRFCLSEFNYDVDELYKGQTRKDIEALGVKDLVIRQSRAVDTFELLESLILENKEDEFAERFCHYYNSEELNAVYNLLKLAAVKGRDICVKTIFSFLSNDNKYTEDIKKQSELSKDLKVICQNGFYRVLKLYLGNIKSGIDNTQPLLLTCLRELRKNRTPVRKKCFQMLLNERRVAIHASDDRKQTALHYAVQHGMDQEAKEILQRKQPPYLWKMNRQNESPLHSMNPEVLEAFLDAQISIPEQQEDKKNEIHLDLHGFKPPKWPQDSEIAPFYYIAETKELRPLLRHPVISSFILVKWLFIRWITYAMFAVSFLFALSFFLYSLTNSSKLKMLCWMAVILYLVRWVYITLIPILLLLHRWSTKERINIRRIHWFRGLNKLRETVMIFLAGYSLVFSDSAILSVLILLAGIDVIVHLRLFPYASLTTSIVMLETVSKSFLKILLIYLIIVISFGCSFFVLFANYASEDQLEGITQNSTTKEDFNNFSTLEGSLVKSLVMMIGELDASEIEFNGHKLSYILFICFVFFVTLVVANLINGVAVSDITEIRQQAQVAALANRVEMLRRFEKCLSFEWFSKHYHRSLLYTRYEPKIIIRTNEGNQLVLIRKKSNSGKQKDKTDPTNHHQCNQTENCSQKPKHPERKFDILGRNGNLHHGVDEDTCKEAKNIAYRNLTKPLSLEAVLEEMSRMNERITRIEGKMDKTLKGEGGNVEKQARKIVDSGKISNHS